MRVRFIARAALARHRRHCGHRAVRISAGPAPTRTRPSTAAGEPSRPRTTQDRERGRSQRPGNRRHRAAPQRGAARRADRGHRLFGRAARAPGRARHHRHRRHHAQRHARNVARHQHHADRLHPRSRPAGPGRRLRAGRRPLSRRRLSQPPAGARCSTFTTSSGSRSCAGRRARSTAATRSAARSNM